MPLAAIQMTGLFCGLVGVRWISTAVSPAVLAPYGLLLSTILIGINITHQGFISQVQRGWTAGRGSSVLFRILAAFGWLPTALLVACVIAIFAASDIETGFAGAWFLWMLATNSLMVLAAAAQAALQAEERYWANFLVSAAGSATRSFLPPLAAGTIAATLPVLGSTFLLHTVILAYLAILALQAGSTSKDSPAVLGPKEAERLTLAMFASGLAAWIASFAPRWFAFKVLPVDDAGCFMLAMSLSAIVPSAASLIGLNYSFPVTFSAGRRGQPSAEILAQSGKTVFSLMVFSQLALAGLAVAGPLLIGPLIDPQYVRVTGWLLATGGAVLATISTPFFSQVLLATGHDGSVALLATASAVFRIVIVALAALTAEGRYLDWSLVVLPWPTVILEWWLTRRLLARARS